MKKAITVLSVATLFLMFWSFNRARAQNGTLQQICIGSAPCPQIQLLTSVVSTTATAATAGAVATTNYTFAGSFTDATFAVNCDGNGALTGAPVVVKAVPNGANGVTVTTMAVTAVAASFGGVQCIGVHF